MYGDISHANFVTPDNNIETVLQIENIWKITPKLDMSVFDIPDTPAVPKNDDIAVIKRSQSEVTVQDDKKWIIDQLKEKNKTRIQEHNQKGRLQDMLQRKWALSISLDLDKEVIILPTEKSNRSPTSWDVEIKHSTESRDPSVIKKFGGFKWYEQSLILEAMGDPELTESLETWLNQIHVQELTKKFSKLQKEFANYSKREEEIDETYKQLMVASLLTEKSIKKVTSSINSRIARVKKLNDQLSQAKIKITTVAPDLRKAKKDVATYTQKYYKLHNDIFSTQSDVSELKLFAKHDSIAETLASDVMVWDLTVELDKLVQKLWLLQATYAVSYRSYTDTKNEIKNELSELKQEKLTLDQQIAHFGEFMLYVRSDKAYTDSKKKELDEAKKKLEWEVDFIWLLSNADTKEDLDKIKSSFSGNVEDEWSFFEFPITEIKKITSFFEDEGYGHLFHTDHFALDFRLAQWSFIYAPAAWYIYKVVDQNSPMLNRFIILHRNGFATVYLHMQDTYVHTGMYVEKGDILGLSWWTPGTRWAWLMTTGPHLHREVWKDGQLVDPLFYTDLSPIKSADMLQKRHKEKWERDNE